MSKQNSDLSRVHRILQKLEQVRARNLSCFGSESHAFRLKPPLSEADLQAFEASHHIRLPEDYRTFLKHAGNGGAGLYYQPCCQLFACYKIDPAIADFGAGF